MYDCIIIGAVRLVYFQLCPHRKQERVLILEKTTYQVKDKDNRKG